MTSSMEVKGFNEISYDELMDVNGGYGSSSSSNVSTGISEVAGGVALCAAGIAVVIGSDGIAAVGGVETFNAGAVLVAFGIGRITGNTCGDISSDIRQAFTPPTATGSN